MGRHIDLEGAPAVCHTTTATCLLPRIWKAFSPLWTRISSLPGSCSTSASKDGLFDEDENIVVRSLPSTPRGYPNLAAFLDSDENFSVYRRFGYLQSRLLLDKQDELRILEEELEGMDKESRESQLVTRDLAPEDAKPRRELLSKIGIKFHEYAHLLSTAQNMTSMNRPSKADYRSVVNYMVNNKPLIKAERSFIRHQEDLVTLRSGREHAWLDSAIEHSLQMLHCRLIEYLFCSKQTQMKTSRNLEDVKTEVLAVYYTRSRIEAVANCVVAAMILLLLVVPVYVLFHLLQGASSDRAYAIAIGVLLVFILTFSAVLRLFTRARRHEILGAAAAYCAVLVVFLGNFGNYSASPKVS